jgi:aspartate 1-decarboxylase
VIVLTYADYEDSELHGFQPRVVHVDASNRFIEPPVGLQPAAR